MISSNIAFDTLNAIDLFGGDFIPLYKSNAILHIPHSSQSIPNYVGFISINKLFDEIDVITDFDCDKIFNVNGVDRIVTPFSRVFCDVERFDNEHDPLFKNGRGFFYTHDSNGGVIRNNVNNAMDDVYNNFYLPHHQQLNELTADKLSKYGSALIIDCHTFKDENYQYDNICIGSDSLHTSDTLINNLYLFFKNAGYSVAFNIPFNGSIIPTNYVGDGNVQSVMIEINQNMYMRNGSPNTDAESVEKLKKLINTMFKV